MKTKIKFMLFALAVLLLLPVTQAAAESVAEQLVGATNRCRAESGVAALRLDTALCRAAQLKADDMARSGCFSHTSAVYGTPGDLLELCGVDYTCVGENIAYGFDGAADVLKAWMGAAGHRQNLLNSVFSRTGVGYNAESGIYVQLFSD